MPERVFFLGGGQGGQAGLPGQGEFRMIPGLR